MHPAGEQPAAKVEALGQRIVQAGIEHQVIAPQPQGFGAHGVQKLRPQAAALQVGTDDEIVDIDKAPVDEVLLQAIAGQADDAFGVPRGQQAIALLRLPGELRHIALRAAEVGTQLLHQGEAGGKDRFVVEGVEGVCHIRCPCWCDEALYARQGPGNRAKNGVNE